MATLNPSADLEALRDAAGVVPPDFDILAGRLNIEAMLEQIAALRKKMSAAELGTMAGVAVLDRFRAAQAETHVRWWKDSALALHGIYATITLGLPLLGFVAGLAIDMAIFGGTAHDLLEISPLYYAFSVGSLVFAVGVGISRGLRKVLMPLMFVACIGASLAAADDPAFRAHFANWLPQLKSTEVKAAGELAVAEGTVSALQDVIRRDEVRLSTGGVPAPDGTPRAILTDGYAANDAEGHALVNDKAEASKKLSDAIVRLNEAKQELTHTSQENPAQYLGRIIGAIYIFAWLAGSQVVIATVIDMGRGIFQRQRHKSLQYRAKVEWVRQFELANERTLDRLVSAAVSDMLMRFNRILSVAAAQDAAKQEHLERLFELSSLTDMKRIGTELVYDTLPPRTSGR